MVKDMLNLLSDAGLSKYESKVYITLVSEGTTTAKNISDITGIPYGKVYEIINSLSYKGFIMMLPSKPMKYKAISPVEVIAAIKNETHQKFEKIKEKILNQIEPLFEENKNFTGPRSTFSIVNGRSNVVKRTEELIRRADKNINIQCSANSLSRLILHKEALKEAADKGINVRIAGITNKENLKEINSLNFCDLRNIRSSKNNFISIDGEECMVTNPAPDDDNILYGRDLGMYVLSCSFTKFIDNFFTSNFKIAKQINFG